MSSFEDEGREPGDVGDDADSLPDVASVGEPPADRESGDEADTGTNA